MTFPLTNPAYRNGWLTQAIRTAHGDLVAIAYEQNIILRDKRIGDCLSFLSRAVLELNLADGITDQLNTTAREAALLRAEPPKGSQEVLDAMPLFLTDPDREEKPYIESHSEEDWTKR